ncbi:hypothetical protein KR51_00006920 [Rubidibacter lacunae KORDI 51-2]|uniref:Uncharacterized protein n=1 Tax=Rubidibacter lacunae KORDI 51-2 TaxID=582515 RepID=U5DLS6_9CHRO|nr:hypothetical protein KR51_00006920 [Rubidibacter lacunae KORDI 51-2]
MAKEGAFGQLSECKLWCRDVFRFEIFEPAPQVLGQLEYMWIGQLHCFRSKMRTCTRRCPRDTSRSWDVACELGERVGYGLDNIDGERTAAQVKVVLGKWNFNVALAEEHIDSKIQIAFDLKLPLRLGNPDE